MKLSIEQFNVLVCLEKKQGQRVSVNKIADEVLVNEEEITQIMGCFYENALIENSDKKIKLTEKAYQKLEPYKVKKALFMAAGIGSRMLPLTKEVPKPLIHVNGKRMIETLLDAVIRADIREIYIVRGYLGEQFDILLDRYPTIKFIDNPLYAEENNISSAYYLKDLMENAYVLESDLILYNPNLIRKYEYSTNYIGLKVNYTDDWCFKVKHGIIEEVLVGGHDVYHMYGISYWNKEDAQKMSKDIQAVYRSDGGKEKFWDEVPLKEYAHNYNIRVRPVKEGDIIEIDTFDELKIVDDIYKATKK